MASSDKFYTLGIIIRIIPPEGLSSYIIMTNSKGLTSVLEPGSGSGDVVSGALALHLDQDPHVRQVL